MEEKTKGGDRGGGDDRRDQRGKRGRNVRRHGIRHLDLQPLAPLQPAVNLDRQNGDEHSEEQTTGIGELTQQDIFHHVHLAIDHHLHRGRRDADKADHRQQAGKQAFDAVDPPQLNTDQKHGADIEEVERGVVKRAGDRLQSREKGE